MRAVAALASLALAACGGGGDSSGILDASPYVPPPPPNPLFRVSGLSPFATGCEGSQSGTNYLNSEVEPFAAVNPVNPGNLVAVWQQDRWSNGGARGLLAGYSTNGGQDWSFSQAPFSICQGGTAANGGDFLRASDPWVTFTPDGKAFFMSLNFSDPTDTSAMLVARSLDGGATWEDPVTLVRDSDPALFNDKNTITADPNDANFVYAVWDRLDFGNLADNGDDSGPTLFTRTTDGGETWEPVREIHSPVFGQTVGNVIAVLPGGRLVNVYVGIDYATDDARLEVILSDDRGETWSGPVVVADLLTVGVRDPQTGKNLRTGGVVPAIAVRAGDGRVAVVWGDGRFSGGARDAIALSLSDDGGESWSAPVAINGAPGAAAFTPAAAYLDDGTLGVSYYDLRDDTPSATTLLASYWLASSSDGQDWSEQRVSSPFDMNRAPDALGLFLGDYMALVAAGDAFQPVFVQTNATGQDRTSVYTVTLQPVQAKALHRASVAPVAPMTAAARARVRETIRRNVPHGRHDPPAWTLPEYRSLP